MDLEFHNGECTNLKSGDKVHLTGCNGYWTVVGVRDHNAVKVQPEDLNEDPIWVGSDEITGKIANAFEELPIPAAVMAERDRCLKIVDAWHGGSRSFLMRKISGKSSPSNPST